MRRHWTWLEPLGFEDGFGESLLSMYRRAATAFSRSLLDVMRDACLVAGLQHPNVAVYSENINGCGWATRALLQALSTASDRDDLACTTLLNAKGFLVDPFRLKRAWCPVCLEDPNPFAPLLWSHRDYGVCLRHSVLMQTRCGKCRREERHLLMRSNPAACAWCGVPLSKAERIPAAASARTLAITRAMRLFHGGDLGAIALASDFAHELTFPEAHRGVVQQLSLL